MESQPTATQQLLSSAKIQLVYGDYPKAIELCTQVLESPDKSGLSADILLEARKIRFDAVYKLYIRDGGRGTRVQALEARHVLMNDAFNIVQEEETHVDANIYMYNRFFETTDEPYRASYHFNRSVASPLCHTLPGITFAIKNAVETYHGGEASLLNQVFQQYYSHFDRIKVLIVEHKLENYPKMVTEMKKALVILKRVAGLNIPIGDFAYSACLLMFHEFCKRNDTSIFSSIQESDVPGAIQMLEEMAGETAPPHLPRDPSTRAENERIGFAQLFMGMLYENGQQVKKNYTVAVKWFKKAAHKHNMGDAALHLGMMYFYGVEGIPKNVNLARLYLEQAVATHSPLAYPTLAILYLHQMEFTKARCLLEKLKTPPEMQHLVKSGSRFGPQYMEWFQVRIMNCVFKWHDKMYILSTLIEKAFEVPLNLSSKGLTFLDRVKRAELFGLKFDITNMMHGAEVILQLQLAPLTGTIHPLEDETQGPGTTPDTSEFSRKIARVREDFQEVTLSLKYEDEGPIKYTRILHMLRQCFENSPSLKLGLYLCQYYDSKTKSKIRNIMQHLLGDPLYASLHLTARIIYVIFHYLEREELKLGTDEDYNLMMTGINLGNSNFPNDPLFYQWMAELVHTPDCSLLLNEAIVGLRVGVDKYENNLALRYSLADYQFRWCTLHMDEVGEECGINQKCGMTHGMRPVDPLVATIACIRYFREFLLRAPPEHPLYPESAFTLAWTYARLLKSCSQSVTKDELLRVREMLGDSGRDGTRGEFYEDIYQAYNQGVVSESKQLECFPQSPSCGHMKARVELFMNMNSTYFPLRKAEPLKDRKHVFSRMYLENPLRVFSTVGLRFRFKGDGQSAKVANVSFKLESLISFKTRLNLIQKYEVPPKTLQHVHSPHFSIIDHSEVPLTVIDEVYFGPELIHVLTEDVNGNTIFIIIRRNSSISRVNKGLTLEFGTTLIIANGFYELVGEEPSCFRVGEVGYKAQVLLTGKVIDMCRFCGAPDSTKRCAKCKRTYCCKECQRKDAKLMKHKYICH